jgi:formate/nitrite transporter FocA (FNT family)
MPIRKNDRFHDYGYWLAAATLGNIAGGIVMVSLLNYGQVKLGESSSPESDLRRAS